MTVIDRHIQHPIQQHNQETSSTPSDEHSPTSRISDDMQVHSLPPTHAMRSNPVSTPSLSPQHPPLPSVRVVEFECSFRLLALVAHLLPLKNLLPITIQLQLDNRQIRRTNSNRCTRSIDFLL